MKLTPAMRAVLRKMREGWSFCLTRGYSARAWLQKDGCGRGGQSQRVHLSTFSGLRARHLIDLSYSHYPTDCYTLTREGERAVKDE